jgi:hypothetical protein
MGLTLQPYLPKPPIAPTDAAGRTRLRGAGATDVLRLTATAPGFALAALGGPGSQWVGVKPRDTEVKVPIVRVRTLAWPVVSGERPVPADGTVIRIAPEPGSGHVLAVAEGRMVDGRLVVDGLNPGYVGALAHAPDGSVARLWADGKTGEGKETSFREPRRIDVALTYADGAPAAGWYVRAMNQGNNPMGPAAVTDAAGKALLDGMHGQLVEVYVAKDGQPWGGRVVGSVDLEKGSGQVTAVVSRMLEGIARVRGGSAALESLHVTIDGAEMAKTEVDDAAGGVRFRWWPHKAGATTTARLNAPGFQPARTEFPTPAAGDVAAVEFDPLPAASIVLRVLAAPDARLHVRLERWNEQTSAWGVTEYGTQSFGPRGRTLTLDARGVGRLDSVVPGRYRAIDEVSKAVSDAIDVVGGGAPAEFTLDTRSSGVVKGRVLVPEGFSPREVTILRDGESSDASPRVFGSGSGQVAADGTFSVPVTGTKPVVLRPSHPVLVPAPDSVSVAVAGPREDVVLRMVAGRTATVRFDRAPVGYHFAPGAHRERVLLYRGEPSGPPASTLEALVEGTTARFGGFEAGTYTVWLDVPPFAPVVLPDVRLGEGDTDLGTVRLSDGSSVRVEVLVKDGQAVPRLLVSATRQGPPTYSRFVNSSGGDVRLTGLGPGTFRVHVGGVMGGPQRKEETVEVDGVADVTLKMDLR